MQSVDKLLENSTNRLALQSVQYPTKKAQTATLSPTTVLLPTVTHRSKELLFLAKQEQIIKQQIEEAQEEQKIMLQLFEQLGKMEQGEEKRGRKMQRRGKGELDNQHRCPHEECYKFYSTEATLQRHIKLKHHIVKNEPPQPFVDLPPWPNLTGGETTPADFTYELADTEHEPKQQ